MEFQWLLGTPTLLSPRDEKKRSFSKIIIDFIQKVKSVYLRPNYQLGFEVFTLKEEKKNSQNSVQRSTNYFSILTEDKRSFSKNEVQGISEQSG